MPSPRVRWLVRGSVALAVVAACAGYIEGMHGMCAECGTHFNRNEVGLQIPWARGVRVAGWDDSPTPSEVQRRWFPPSHEHGSQRFSSGTRALLFGLVMEVHCGRTPPGPFLAAALSDDGLPDFVDAEIAAGRIDVETVRRLCAMHDERPGADQWLRSAEETALLRRGCELVGAFRGVAPAETRLWGASSWKNGWDDPAPAPSPGPK